MIINLRKIHRQTERETKRNIDIYLIMQAAFAINFIRQFKLLLKYRSMIRWCKEWQFLAIRCIYLASRDNSLLSAIVSIILEPALKIFFPSPSLSFFFFTELIIHSTLFLHHGNWFSHKSNDFFFFLASFEISRKDVSIQFHPICPYKIFRLWFALWSKCFG